MSGNSTAWLVLYSWPLFAIVFYRLWTPQVATAATLICGYLFLPYGIGVDPPALPQLDRDFIASCSALVLTWIVLRNPRNAAGALPGWLPRETPVRLLIALLVLGAFGTALTNMDSVQNGGIRLPGMRLYDGFSVALSVMTPLIPLLLARKLMATAEGHRTLAVFLVGAGVAYAFLALYEVRMSPQLNARIYGFFPHSWLQHIRNGGFRPIIFLEHGLFVGIFLASATIVAFGLALTEPTKNRAKFAAAGALLLITIFFSKVLGAFVITLTILMLLYFSPRRIQVLAAMSLSAIVLTYPMLRSIDVVPTNAAVSLARQVSAERAESLAFRVRNENVLLERARERPLFGWGGYGRNRVYNDAGTDISTTDGRWLILFGQGGWIRYLGEFGLLLWGVFRLGSLPRDKLDPITVVLILALVANLIDLIPNAGLSPITWLLTGEGDGTTPPAEMGAPDPDMSVFLAELREIRAAMRANAERAAQLEKRMRKALLSETPS
mgnify:CR=1 FL=1